MILNWGTGLTRPGRKSSPRTHTMICLNAVDIIFIMTDFMGVVRETYLLVIFANYTLLLSGSIPHQETTNNNYIDRIPSVNCSETICYVNSFVYVNI